MSNETKIKKSTKRVNRSFVCVFNELNHYLHYVQPPNESLHPFIKSYAVAKVIT